MGVSYEEAREKEEELSFLDVLNVLGFFILLPLWFNWFLPHVGVPAVNL